MGLVCGLCRYLVCWVAVLVLFWWCLCGYIDNIAALVGVVVCI